MWVRYVGNDLGGGANLTLYYLTLAVGAKVLYLFLLTLVLLSYGVKLP